MICFHEVGFLRAMPETRFIPRLGAPLLGLLTIYFVFFFESSTPEPVFAQESQLAGGDIIPIRQLSDPYPVFNGIAVDPVNGLVAMTDVNRKSLLTYSRTDGFPPWRNHSAETSGFRPSFECRIRCGIGAR